MISQMEANTENGLLASCEKCGRAVTCTWLRALAPLLGKEEDATRPFEPKQLAAICRFYLPLETLNL